MKLVFALCTFLLLPVPVDAIVIRDDRPDSAYLQAGAKFPEVGYVMDQVGCTLIDVRWAITAAHSVEGLSPFSDRFVRFAGRRYAVEKVVIPKERTPFAVDSSADIALLKLSTGVPGIAPAAVYDKSDEVDKVVWLVGRGGTGTPHSEKIRSDGKIRAGTTTIEAAFQASLASVFHQPPLGTDLEANAAGGDSGGPAIWVERGRHHLLGVISIGSGTSADRSANQYQRLSGYARMSAWHAWIADTIAGDPPSTILMWTPLKRIASSAQLPPTPTGQTARSFIDAYNAGTADRLAQFYAAHTAQRADRSNEMRAHTWDETRRDWGDLDVRAYTDSGPAGLAVAAYSPTRKSWFGILFEFDPAVPGRVASFTSGEITEPAIP